MNSFWIALFFVLVAEMGDKTQLVALASGARYKTSTVMAGVFGATLVIHLFSVVLGEAAGTDARNYTDASLSLRPGLQRQTGRGGGDVRTS